MTHLDEQRVVEALHTYTGGLIVTDHDIAVAESRLRNRIEPPSPRRRRVVLAAAVAAVLVVGFFVSQAFDRNQQSAPPADGPSSPADTMKEALQADAYDVGFDSFIAGAQPTAQDLAGFWLLREPFSYPMFVEADGDWVRGTPTDKGGFGSSTLAGNTWTLQHDDRGICVSSNQMHGVTQSWQAALASDGSLRLSLTGGEPDCTPGGAREVWDRISVGSPVADYLLVASKDSEWQAAPRLFRWQGLYVAPATGHVLDVTPEEKYSYYDTLTDASLVAADRGGISYDGSTQRTTGSCADGAFTSRIEVARLPGVDGYLGSYEAVRVRPTETCPSGVSAEDLWVKVY